MHVLKFKVPSSHADVCWFFFLFFSLHFAVDLFCTASRWNEHECFFSNMHWLYISFIFGGATCCASCYCLCLFYFVDLLVTWDSLCSALHQHWASAVICWTSQVWSTHVAHCCVLNMNSSVDSVQTQHSDLCQCHGGMSLTLADCRLNICCWPPPIRKYVAAVLHFWDNN